MTTVIRNFDRRALEQNGLIERLRVSITTSTTTPLKAAAAGKKHYLLDFVATVKGDQNVIVRSGAQATGGMQFDFDAGGHINEHARDGEVLMETTVGEALNVVTDAAQPVQGYAWVVTLNG